MKEISQNQSWKLLIMQILVPTLRNSDSVSLMQLLEICVLICNLINSEEVVLRNNFMKY